nr:retrovirus-related Pol polyprotein from transposon TNT 1-94 [Tanacetum cinerariifolium]
MMVAGSRDRPSMLATGQYPQWHLRFLRYIDTRPNGKALRKCILSGPYKPITILVQAVEASDDSLAVPKHTTVETPINMSPENKAHFLAEKEAIHLILTGIGDEIYSIPEWSRFVTIVKQQHKLDEVSYHKLFNILKQYQNEVNELCAERLARNTNPLALVATTQADRDPYHQTSRSHRSSAPSSKASIPTRSHTTTRHKGKEIAKPITPPSETAFKEDNDPEQAQRDTDMQKNLALIAKYFKKIYKPTNNNLRTSSNSKNKNVDTTPRYKNDDHSGQFGNQRMVNVAGAREKVGSPVVQQSGIQCFNCMEFGHFAKECRKPKRAKDFAYHKEKMLLCKQAEQELEAHYSYMAKIQEVPTADSGIDSKPVEQVQNNAGYNVSANGLQHSEQSVSNDQNDVESNDERVALANLIANLKLDTKQTEFEKYKAFNDRTIDYDKLEQKEIDEFESDKAEFSNMYDEILQDCVSKDVMCSYLQSLSNLDALAELQCMYLHKVKECDCLAQKLSKQTESVSKKVHSELLQRFAKVEKHSISLEIALKKCKERILQLIIFIGDSGCTKHMTGNLKLLCNFVEKVHYVEGLNHNLFSVGQFCDANLEVAFRKSTCFVRNLQGNDLLTGNYGSDIYTISLQESTSSTPLCLMAKATPTQAWLWHLYNLSYSLLTLDFAPILGYGDLVQGYVTINRVYYVEGLNHNLFSVGQFCDADLEVAFKKSTCFVRDLQGNDLLIGNCGFDLYIISLQESTSSTPLCLMTKASPTQAWLWPRRISHLNFDYINLLSKKVIVTGLPKLKYVKDQLCSSYELSKAKRSSFKSKVVPKAESSSYNIGNSNVPTFNQPQVSEYRWMKDHPLEQVHGNPLRLVQTRRQLAIDPEMCMYVLTMSTAELKNIKEAMADSACIKAMQEELHQFNRLQNWRDLPKDTSYLEIAVLRYDGDECDKGRMPTKIELTLEQSQQGVSNGILTRHHGPSDAMHNPSQPFEFLSTETCLICHGDNTTSIDFLTSSLLILNRWQSALASDY